MAFKDSSGKRYFILSICALNIWISFFRRALALITEGLQNNIFPLKSNFSGEGFV